MALRPCRECGQQVSTEAASCPRCGVPNPASTPPPDPIRAAELESTRREHPLQVHPAGTRPNKHGLWKFGALLLACMLLAVVAALLDRKPQSSGMAPVPATAPLTRGQSYRVKRQMPACPTPEHLSRIMQLVAAKDYQATSIYILREGCLVLQQGWAVTYEGRGGYGVIRVRRPGDPDVLFTPQESIE